MRFVIACLYQTGGKFTFHVRWLSYTKKLGYAGDDVVLHYTQNVTYNKLQPSKVSALELRYAVSFSQTNQSQILSWVAVIKER